MGLFDFFKKKNLGQTEIETSKSSLFASISKYDEYIIKFIELKEHGLCKPISAYEKPDGEIVGLLYFIGNNWSYILSDEDYLGKMEQDFESKLSKKLIKSYAIIYWSQFNSDNNHKFVDDTDELKAISISYDFENEQKGKIALQKNFDEKGSSYYLFPNFTSQENNNFFSIKLPEDKIYFTESVEIEAPCYENKIGLRIKKSNNYDLNTTWCGVFGLESFQKPEGGQTLIEYNELTLNQKKSYSKENVSISQLEFDDINFKAVSLNKILKVLLPIVKTDYIVEVVNDEINEWENIENLGAIITGTGKNLFGLSYFATDYAENREIYQSQNSLNIKLSGIAFEIDINEENIIRDNIEYSKKYTEFFHHKDFPSYGCFDFIGILIDFKETRFLENKDLAYILKVSLISHPKIDNFFIIDIFAVPENIKCLELKKGMKIRGTFQMQGQITN